MSRLALVLILLSGCTAPREAMRDLPDPQSLDEVNELLRGAVVRVVLFDAEPISDASEVTVAADSVRLTVGRRDARRVAVATSAVGQITTVRGRGTRAGALAGAVPGLLAILSSTASTSSPREGERAAGASVLTFGVPAIVAGAALGGWLGQLAVPGETVTLYRAPLQRYAPVRPPPPPPVSR